MGHAYVQSNWRPQKEDPPLCGRVFLSLTRSLFSSASWRRFPIRPGDGLCACHQIDDAGPECARTDLRRHEVGSIKTERVSIDRSSNVLAGTSSSSESMGMATPVRQLH